MIAVDGGQYAQHDAGAHRQNGGHEHKLQSRGQSAGDQLRHRLLPEPTLAEIALDRGADKVHELQVKWIVQAQRLADLLPLLEGRILAHQAGNRIADKREQ